jgi:DNA-nicking Smr family endonuclease
MPRRLSSEDREAWDRVRRSATPLRPEPAWPQPSGPVAAPPAPEPPAPEPPAPPAVRAPFRLGQAARPQTLAPAALPTPLPAPLRMDAGTFGRMNRGKLRPEARIDLHGLTVAEAHPALQGFILDAHRTGRRLVLVITGKGRASDDWAPMPTATGRLRQDVPRWLALPPLGSLVQQVAPAHRRHGGEGALYVYLRAPGRR